MSFYLKKFDFIHIFCFLMGRRRSVPILPLLLSCCIGDHKPRAHPAGVACRCAVNALPERENATSFRFSLHQISSIDIKHIKMTPLRRVSRSSRRPEEIMLHLVDSEQSRC